MKKIIGITAGVLAAFTLAACSSGPTAAPPSTTSSTTTTSATPSPSNEAQVGSSVRATAPAVPPLQTDTMDIATNDGYQAHVTINWNAERIIPHAEALPGCAEFLQFDHEDGANFDYHTITANLSADFPEVAGFKWPDTSYVSVGFGDGNGYDCFTGQDLDVLPSTPNPDKNLTPERSTITAMWIIPIERTPNNPTGLPSADQLAEGGIDISIFDGTCTNTTAHISDSGTNCSSSYPRSLVSAVSTIATATS